MAGFTAPLPEERGAAKRDDGEGGKSGACKPWAELWVACGGSSCDLGIELRSLWLTARFFCSTYRCVSARLRAHNKPRPGNAKHGADIAKGVGCRLDQGPLSAIVTIHGVYHCCMHAPQLHDRRWPSGPATPHLAAAAGCGRAPPRILGGGPSAGAAEFSFPRCTHCFNCERQCDEPHHARTNAALNATVWQVKRAGFGEAWPRRTQSREQSPAAQS